jgi:hypothetical protein
VTEPRPTAPVSLGKGRPTPKRSEKERRTGPVAPPPRTRKEAAARLREEQAQARKTQRAGVAAGDDSALLRRDRGPVRALVRDVVDSRRNVGVLLLPLALLLVLARFVGSDQLLVRVTDVWIAGIVAMFIDVVLIGLRVRRTLAAAGDRLPADADRSPARHIGYAVLRSTVFRRLRTPPPRVAVGTPLPR